MSTIFENLRGDARALTVEDGRIVALDAAERGIDLAGAVVLPGLIDSHFHLASLGASLVSAQLVDCASEAEAVARVAA